MNHSSIEEKIAKTVPGMPILILNIVLMALAVFGIISAGIRIDAAGYAGPMDTILLVVPIVYLAAPAWMLLIGLKVLRPNEAYVLTLFGKYYGSLKGPGFFFVNPFAMAANPLKQNQWEAWALASAGSTKAKKTESGKSESGQYSSKISLKTLTLNNNKQKINDLLGNPIEIGIVVIWRVVNTAKAVFNVENYEEYLSTQSDSALRNIVRLYPYDIPGDDGEETSLRASAAEISEKIQEEIQSKADIAGLEIIDARITHLAYAPEIAAAMLQRQQASAIIDARAAIVNGAVGMVEQALAQLNEKEIVNLDEERKAAMVSNLLVVLCGNRDAQPIINSGTIY
ncbi:membrane protein [Clostridia bacterium]|nr:membrane protein [Clostridia bacterium]